MGDKLLKTNLLILSKFLQYVWVFFSLKKKKKKCTTEEKRIKSKVRIKVSPTCLKPLMTSQFLIHSQNFQRSQDARYLALGTANTLTEHTLNSAYYVAATFYVA